MVNQIYTDLQKIKCYNLWSKLPVKKSNVTTCDPSYTLVNPDKQNLSFWELSQKGSYDIDLWLHI